MKFTKILIFCIILTACKNIEPVTYPDFVIPISGCDTIYLTDTIIITDDYNQLIIEDLEAKIAKFAEVKDKLERQLYKAKKKKRPRIRNNKNSIIISGDDLSEINLTNKNLNAEIDRLNLKIKDLLDTVETYKKSNNTDSGNKAVSKSNHIMCIIIIIALLVLLFITNRQKFRFPF